MGERMSEWKFDYQALKQAIETQERYAGCRVSVNVNTNGWFIDSYLKRGGEVYGVEQRLTWEQVHSANFDILSATVTKAGEMVREKAKAVAESPPHA